MAKVNGKVKMYFLEHLNGSYLCFRETKGRKKKTQNRHDKETRRGSKNAKS